MNDCTVYVLRLIDTRSEERFPHNAIHSMDLCVCVIDTIYLLHREISIDFLDQFRISSNSAREEKERAKVRAYVFVCELDLN